MNPFERRSPKAMPLPARAAHLALQSAVADKGHIPNRGTMAHQAPQQLALGGVDKLFPPSYLSQNPASRTVPAKGSNNCVIRPRIQRADLLDRAPLLDRGMS